MTVVAELKAGRELDAMVAERVMGKVPCTNARAHLNGEMRPCHALPEFPDEGGETPTYSTSIEAAWEVVEKLQQRGMGLHLAVSVDGYGCSAVFVPGIRVTARTAPLAICLASLNAVGA